MKKKTCIEFKKYADCRFWANIYKIYWDYCSVRKIPLQEKDWGENQLIGYQCCSSDVLCFDLYIQQTYRHYVQTGSYIYADMNISGTNFFVLLDPTVGAW